MAENKIIFSDTRKTSTIELPSFPGSQVVVYNELNIGQQREVANAPTGFEQGLKTAEVAIKEWNLFEDENTPLPISIETFKRFPEKDMLVIFSAISGMSVEQLTNIEAPGEVKKNTRQS